MSHYVKCKYEKGMWDNEKIVTINTCSMQQKQYSFFAFDTELVLLENNTGLIRIVSGYPLDKATAKVMLREQGNPCYFTVPLEDIVERK